MKLTNETIIDLLAEGYKGSDICRMYAMKKAAYDRRIERLKAKYQGKSITHLVVTILKLKNSGVSTTEQQPNY